MSEQRNQRRIRERLALHLPVRVQGRETTDFQWIEMTRLTNVTPFGAGFTLKRPTEKGRLLHMTIPMPRQLRVFDHVEDQYRIWAVVRYTRAKSSDTGTVFDVGVAFIGKRAPASYEQQPWKRYEVITPFEAVAAAENMVKLAVTHPGVIIASDGWLQSGKGHPRAAGTYSRVLARYVREQRALSLMEALRKMLDERKAL